MSAKLYAAEFCLPGHPDKLCDAIADALVEEAARRERRALCGVEVSVHRATVFVTGVFSSARIPETTIVSCRTGFCCWSSAIARRSVRSCARWTWAFCLLTPRERRSSRWSAWPSECLW